MIDAALLRNKSYPFILCIVLLGAVCIPCIAQLPQPSVDISGRDMANPFPASAAQGMYNTQALSSVLGSLFPSSSDRYPKDSLKVLIRDRAGAWLGRFKEGPAQTGMQLDNMGKLSAIGYKNEEARTYFAKRLATPKLPFVDRVYTFISGFETFLDHERPELLPIAKEYLQQIDAMGEKAIHASIRGRFALATTYYKIGVPDSVLLYGTEGLEMIPRLPFVDRPFVRNAFLIVADALVPKVNGRAEIVRLGNLLMDHTQPSAADVSLDSSLVSRGILNKQHLERDIATARMLGNPVPGIVAHFWLNSTKTGYAEQSLGDGKIRIIELGHFHCPACIAALPGMKRLGDRYSNSPDVSVMYVTNTAGFWGIKQATPAEEVEGLAEYYLKKRGLNFPIAIWAPERELDSETGDFAIPESPNYKAFGVTGTPRFCVVDGKGRLRRVITGYTRSIEQDIIDVVDYLLKEAAMQSGSK